MVNEVDIVELVDVLQSPHLFIAESLQHQESELTSPVVAEQVVDCVVV